MQVYVYIYIYIYIYTYIHTCTYMHAPEQVTSSPRLHVTLRHAIEHQTDLADHGALDHLRYLVACTCIMCMHIYAHVLFMYAHISVYVRVDADVCIAHAGLRIVKTVFCVATPT